MLKLKKTKSAFVGLALMAASSLTACGNTEQIIQPSTSPVSASKEIDNTTEKETEATTEKKEEVTTAKEVEATTEKKVEEKTPEQIKEEREIYFYNLAAESYNEYTQFYAETKMAYKDENARGGININRIVNVIKVINGEVADLTPDEVKNAKEDMHYILLPQTLAKDIKFIHGRNDGYLEIDGEMKITKLPVLSKYASDEETREFTKKYESLRDEVVLSINSVADIPEQVKMDLKDAIFEMVDEHVSDDNIMNNDVTAEGNKLLENLAKEALVDLTAGATNEARIVSDKHPEGVVLVPETDEEREIESKALIHGIEILTDREKEIYANTSMKVLAVRYEEGVCAHLQNLIDHAKTNTNVYSKKEEYKKLKEQLTVLSSVNESLKEQNIELVYTI